MELYLLFLSKLNSKFLNYGKYGLPWIGSFLQATMYTEKVVQIIEALAGEPFSERNPIDEAIIRFSIVNRPHCEGLNWEEKIVFTCLTDCLLWRAR